MYGTDEGNWVSMGVISDGSYGIKEGMVFSFPVTVKNGEYTIVKDLPLSEHQKEKIQLGIEELLEEREMTVSLLNDDAETTSNG